MEDIRKATQPPKCGSTGTGTSGYYIPNILDDDMGLKFKHRPTLYGGGELDLGIERGELHRQSHDQHLLRPGAFFNLAQYRFCSADHADAQEARSESRDVPTIYELMDRDKTPEASRRLATVLLAPALFGGGWWPRPAFRPIG